MDYGRDFRLADDDLVFTPEGDLEVIEGPACVAQDIDQTLKTVTGRLPWAPETGSTLTLMLNGPVTEGDVTAELERVAIRDARTDPQTVKAYRKPGGAFRLDFTPLGAIRPEVLDYDLKEGNRGR
jgi:hypothetical protein